MSDETFYLPHEPIKYDSETRILSIVLPYFYTNAHSEPHLIFPARISEPTLFRVSDEKMIPKEIEYLKVAYDRKGPPNCAGVSQYKITEGSKRDLQKYWETRKA